jgi:capsular polysaccharide biosynthesis protein
MGQAFLFKNDCLLDAPDLLPDYVRHTVEAGKQWEIDYALPVRKIEGCFIVLVSNAYQVYGHWIVDILPRLWLAMNHCPSGVNPSIILPIDTPAYAISIIEKLFGKNDYVYHDIYRENLNLEEVYSPSLLHNSHYFHVAINDFISFVLNHDFINNTRKLNTKSLKHIFITRQKFRDSSSSYARSMINEDEVLELMREMGFEIISPEDFSWEDQVRIFSDAEIIIGEAGSAMHNTIFSGEGAIVICLNPTNHLQSSIAAIRNQKIMSICSKFESCGDNIKYYIDVERLRTAAKSAVAQTSTN